MIDAKYVADQFRTLKNRSYNFLDYGNFHHDITQWWSSEYINEFVDNAMPVEIVYSEDGSISSQWFQGEYCIFGILNLENTEYLQDNNHSLYEVIDRKNGGYFTHGDKNQKNNGYVIPRNGIIRPIVIPVMYQKKQA